MADQNKKRAPLNRTLTINKSDVVMYKSLSIRLTKKNGSTELKNKIINQDLFTALNYLPEKFVDLMFIDPPYNLYKRFSKVSFKEMENSEYENWVDSWLSKLVKTLKPTASIYFCCDWKTSVSAYNVLKKYFKIQNRITWEREKGRGAKSNWKNSHEDIWFCTLTDDYIFNTESVKLKRVVRAPYKKEDGNPKDWKSENGRNFRITYPSNLWTDVTVPFWSMVENTDHPTQKPEKLLAKIILASSDKNQFVFDPFLGSGTTAVAAKKLDRNYCGIEIDEMFCITALKRLELAENDKSIQGYEDGVFWERNTLSDRKKNN